MEKFARERARSLFTAASLIMSRVMRSAELGQSPRLSIRACRSYTARLRQAADDLAAMAAAAEATARLAFEEERATAER